MTGDLDDLDIWLRHRIDETQSRIDGVERSESEYAAACGRIVAYKAVRHEIAHRAASAAPAGRTVVWAHEWAAEALERLRLAVRALRGQTLAITIRYPDLDHQAAGDTETAAQ